MPYTIGQEVVSRAGTRYTIINVFEDDSGYAVRHWRSGDVTTRHADGRVSLGVNSERDIVGLYDPFGVELTEEEQVELNTILSSVENETIIDEELDASTITQALEEAVPAPVQAPKIAAGQLWLLENGHEAAVITNGRETGDNGWRIVDRTNGQNWWCGSNGKYLGGSPSTDPLKLKTYISACKIFVVDFQDDEARFKLRNGNIATVYNVDRYTVKLTVNGRNYSYHYDGTYQGSDRNLDVISKIEIQEPDLNRIDVDAVVYFDENGRACVLPSTKSIPSGYTFAAVPIKASLKRGQGI
jgi:hypothetical protein